MQARKDRSHDKITTNASYFSGDERQPSNEGKSRNFSPRRPRSTKTLPSKELNKRNVISKQNQTAETLEWLSENYELIHGVCVPRCVLYTHYLDFCKKRKFSPAGPATFGKLIRQKFPKLTTRRLGTRGQSKYHYYGISIKESSVYYHSVYSGKGLTRFSGTEGKKKGMTKKLCLDKKSRNTLPEFPKASEMILNEDLSVEKVETFIIMYRTHCQRLLDTVMNANFDEVHKFLLHFWRGMPQHMIPVLECDAVIDIIIVCDSLLYKILNDVLVPSCIQDIPESLTEEIQDFAITFVSSLESCLENTPAILKNQKLQVAKNFVRLLKRNMSFINLAQTARPVFLSYESMSGILNEFRCLDLRKILSELLFLTEQDNVELPVLLMFMEEFENLLVKQAPLEAYAEWFDSVVEDYVLKNDEKMSDASENDLSRRSQRFLTSWAFITSRILQELTLKGAPTFGSFQLIIMMFEEYILLIIENQMIAQLDESLKLGLKRHLKNTGSIETSIVESLKAQKGEDKQKPNVPYNPKQRGAYSVQDKGKQMHLLQNIEQEMQHCGNFENHQSHSHGYDVSTNPCYSAAQQNLPPQAGQLGNLAPTQDNFTTNEVYLGINAVPSEIYRIENVRGNQAHAHNLMCTSSGEDNVNFSKVATDKNGGEMLQTAGNNFVTYSYSGDANHFEAYNMKGQDSQGHFSGRYQSLTVNQAQYGSQSQQGKVIYQGDPHQDQSSNQDYFECSNNGQHQSQIYFHNNGQGQSRPGQSHLSQSRGEGQKQQSHQGQGSLSQGLHGQTHPFQGHMNQDHMNQRHLNQDHVGYSKDYQYENQLHLHTPDYSSQNHVNLSQNLFEQNMNYCQTNDNSNYQCTESASLNRQTSQENSLNFTNNNYQEKTTLPSFFQLSSQLSCNARLSAGY